MVKVYIETYGCTFNKADSQIMKGILKKKGFDLVERAEKADVIIINTCYVKLPTQQKMIGRIGELKKYGKSLVIAGCMVEIDEKTLLRIAPKAAWIGPHRIKDVCYVVEQLLKGKIIRLIGEKKEIKVTLPYLRENPVIEIVPICEGCVGTCSYCCTKFARKKLFSYPAPLILSRIRKAVRNGVREIWLTSQDTALYSWKDKRLGDLLGEICKVKGKFFVRIGMMNPSSLLRVFDGFLVNFKKEKVFKFIHLPVESGSNRILELMRRNYSVEEFVSLVSSLRKEVKELTLSTDIIVGFPGERKLDFKKSYKLIKKIEPDIVNLSKYGPRPGTDASKMKMIPQGEVKRRSKKLYELVRKISLKRNIAWIGWKGEVLIDEKGKGNTWVGRNYTYKPIIVCLLYTSPSPRD